MNRDTSYSSYIQPTTKIIQNFSVYFWLSALMAVSFAGASFGFGGLIGGVGGFIVAGVAGFFSLSMAYNKREQKDALKTLSDGVAISGMVLFLVMIFSIGLVAGLIVLLLFLHIALNLAFREHRQVYFGLLVNFVALMSGAVNTFSAGYLFFMLAFCVCACFYMAVAFVDCQQYELIENQASSLTSTSKPIQSELSGNLNSSHLTYVGEWKAWDKLLMAGMISLIAGVIYLLTPQLPAGNLGSVQIEGFGKYAGADIEEQILPEGSDLSERFRNPPTANNSQKDKPTNQGGSASNSGFGQGNDSLGLMPSDDCTHDISDFDANDVKKGFNTADSPLDNSIFYYVKSASPRYLQFDTATYFDGHSWHRLQYGWRKLPNQLGSSDFTLYPDKPNASVGVTVVKSCDSKNLLTTDNTVGIRFPSEWVASDYYDQLKVGSPLKEGTSYELMLVDKQGEKTGRMIDTNQASPDAKDLQLPNDLDPRIKQLGDKLLVNTSSNIEKANILEHHLRTSYEYTLDTVSNQNNIPLADFLFGSQRGHCEYFATAMAVMLRQQGIPARMISGYVAQDYNPVTGFYEVKGTNGHAWVQAYVDGEWTTYEATGAYNSPQEDAKNAEKTRNTNEVIKEYLEQVNEQDERLQETQELTLWQQLQVMLRSFWYIIVSVFSAMVTLLRLILPWLLSMCLVVGILGWLVWQRWQSQATERADKKGMRDLQKLGQQIPKSHEEMKTYIHKHLQIYQNMLTRHDVSRPMGQQVEDFANSLLNKNLATTEQARILVEITNGEFYLTQENKHTANNIHKLFINLYEQALVNN